MDQPSIAERAAALAEQFEQHVGRAPEVAAAAPGRVNLIGEHTDYTEGLVLPCAIDRHTVVVAARLEGPEAIVHAVDLDAVGRFDLDVPERRGDWLDYVQGVAFQLVDADVPVPGFVAMVSSSVPLGAGLSSSAALGVSVCAALSTLSGESLTPRTWAEFAHRAESEFVGVGCGILDQYASALGQRDHALRIDCRYREVEPVALAGPPLALLIVHSGVSRSLAAEGAYRERVAECAEAAAVAAEHGMAPALGTLRDVEEAALPALERALSPRLFARARHVVTENARVDRFVSAMQAGDHAALGELLRAGQASLRDDYAVSIPELDALCEIGDATPGVVGSRLTGAGFGGCTLHWVAEAEVEAAAEAIAEGFLARHGRRPECHGVRMAAGATLLDL